MVFQPLMVLVQTELEPCTSPFSMRIWVRNFPLVISHFYSSKMILINIQA